MPPGTNDMPYWRPRGPFSLEPSANGRYSKQAKQDEDIVMVDAGGPSETPGLKRSDSSAKKAAAGLGGMLGGFLSKPRPEPKRRSTLDDGSGRGLRREDRKIKRFSENPDVTMTGGIADEDQEAQDSRRAARRARRAEKEAIEKAAEEARKAKDAGRRERRRKQEEESEARRQEEKEARRAARKEQKALEEAERQAAEAKQAERSERRRAKRAERDARAEATQTDGEALTEGPERLKRSDRRKSHMDGTEDEEERRRRREERRAARGIETPRTSRRKSAPIVDSYFDTRNGSKAEKESKRKSRQPGWPHSGTDSWVQDHSDAPPPPEDAPATDAPGDTTAGDERERRRMRKTRHQNETEAEEDAEERRIRREARRNEREQVKSSEGSQGDGRRSTRRESGFIEPRSRAASSTGGIFSRWRR